MGSSIKSAVAVSALAASLFLPGKIHAQRFPGELGAATASNATPVLLPLPSTNAAVLPDKPEPRGARYGARLAIAEATARPAAFRVRTAQKPERAGSKRIWLLIAFAEHGAATFDAYTTRQAIRDGNNELDPLMRPFAHSAAVYPAMQAESVLFDFLGRRMMRSRRGWMRRIWWLPQTLVTAGFIWSGIHNANLPRVGTR